MADDPHACCNWVFSGHDCNPDIPWDHHMCIVSGFTRCAPTFVPCGVFLYASCKVNTRYFPICSEQGYEEGLSTLGMVSGLFGAVWSMGWVLLDPSSKRLLLFLIYIWVKRDVKYLKMKSVDVVYNVSICILKWKRFFFFFLKDVLWPSGGGCYHAASELQVGSCSPGQPAVSWCKYQLAQRSGICMTKL